MKHAKLVQLGKLRTMQRRPKQKAKRKSSSCPSSASASGYLGKGFQYLESAEICRRQGDIGQAFSFLSLGLSLQPELKESFYKRYFEVLDHWSGRLLSSNQQVDAFKLFDVAQSLYPLSPDLHFVLAQALYRCGNVREGWEYARKAYESCRHDPCVRQLHSALCNALVERWHFPMINCKQRNLAFKKAIDEAVKDGCHSVLDLGAGTGLLSIYASWSGAKHVYACEMNAFMCEMARSILEANKQVSVEVLPCHSSDVIIGKQLQNRVPLIVTETVDAGLLGEHILSTLKYAWEELLLSPLNSYSSQSADKTRRDFSTPEDQSLAAKEEDIGTKILKEVRDPGSASDVTNAQYTSVCHTSFNKIPAIDPGSYGRVIPNSAEIFVCVVQCQYIACQTKIIKRRLHFLKDWNIQILSDEPYMSEKLDNIPGGFRELSPWTTVSCINFNSPNDIEKYLKGEVDKTLHITCLSEGRPDALVLAYNLHIGSEVLSTLPGSSTCWENALYPVYVPTYVTVGTEIAVQFTCDGIIHLRTVESTKTGTNNSEAGLLEDKTVLLGPYMIKCLNSTIYTDFFSSACTAVADKLLSMGITCPIICDTTPFPLGGIILLNRFPSATLQVSSETVCRALQQLEISAFLSEDKTEKINVLFLWPLTKEGVIDEISMQKIKGYMSLLADDGIVFPEYMTLHLAAVDAPELENMTRIDDRNTLGVAVADSFNFVKTDFQLDITLSSLPHKKISTVIPFSLHLPSGEIIRNGKTAADTRVLHIEDLQQLAQEKKKKNAGDVSIVQLSASSEKDRSYHWEKVTEKYSLQRTDDKNYSVTGFVSIVGDVYVAQVPIAVNQKHCINAIAYWFSFEKELDVLSSGFKSSENVGDLESLKCKDNSEGSSSLKQVNSKDEFICKTQLKTTESPSNEYKGVLVPSSTVSTSDRTFLHGIFSNDQSSEAECITLETCCKDSPVNQCAIMLDSPVYTDGDCSLLMKVFWRNGNFHVILDHLKKI